MATESTADEPAQLPTGVKEIVAMFALFATWDHFGIAAMKSESKMAEFGFETYEVDGVRYMLASELSLRVYRHVNTAALRALLARYDRPLISLRSAQHDVALSLKKAFGLHPKAAWTMFATWDHFGIVAMKSETPMALKVQAYFLNAGVRVAADRIAEHETGHSVIQLHQIIECFGAIERINTTELIHPMRGTDGLTLIAGARRLEATQCLGATITRVQARR